MVGDSGSYQNGVWICIKRGVTIKTQPVDSDCFQQHRQYSCSLDVVDDVGNQPPPPKPLNCSQYGDIQLVKALDVPPAPAIPAETPKVVEVVRAGSSQEDIVTLQSELAASRNSILVINARIITI